MVISIRMTSEEKELADAYARLNGVSLSEAIKRAYFEKIEEEFDIALADASLKEYEKNPKTYARLHHGGIPAGGRKARAEAGDDRRRGPDPLLRRRRILYFHLDV